MATPSRQELLPGAPAERLLPSHLPQASVEMWKRCHLGSSVQLLLEEEREDKDGDQSDIFDRLIWFQRGILPKPSKAE